MWYVLFPIFLVVSFPQCGRGDQSQGRKRFLRPKPARDLGTYKGQTVQNKNVAPHEGKAKKKGKTKKKRRHSRSSLHDFSNTEESREDLDSRLPDGSSSDLSSDSRDRSLRSSFQTGQDFSESSSEDFRHRRSDGTKSNKLTSRTSWSGDSSGDENFLDHERSQAYRNHERYLFSK